MNMEGEEDDDWSIPYRSQNARNPQNSMPRPAFGDASSSVYNSNREKRSLLESRYANKLSKGGEKQSTLVKYGPASDSTPVTSSSEDLISTDELDIDFEGALASLPPVYRDVLRRQLALVQNRKVNPGQSETLANNASEKPLQKESRKLSDESPAIEARQVNLNNVASAHSNENLPSIAPGTSNLGPIVESIASSETKTPAVSIRLNDLGAEPSSSNVTTASASIPQEQPTQVANARTNNPVINHLQANEVVPASSVTPVVLTPMVASANSNPTIASVNSPSWQQSVNVAIEQLEKQVRDAPNSDQRLRLSQEITLRMLYVSQRRLEDAVRPLPKEVANESEQEFLRHEMMALYEASNPDAMPVRSRHWSLVMNSQREATNHLAAVSNLEVKTIAFCTEVERYGVITKFPKNQFQADQEVLLYCEIENVAANPVRNGFETQLSGSYEIIDSQGRKVADQFLPMEPEICQNHRRDYFIVYKIYMPQQIVSGNYQLRLTVEDMNARKYGQGQTEFQIEK